MGDKTTQENSVDYQIDRLLDKVRVAAELGEIDDVLSLSDEIKTLRALCPDCSYYFGNTIVLTKRCEDHKSFAELAADGLGRVAASLNIENT